MPLGLPIEAVSGLVEIPTNPFYYLNRGESEGQAYLFTARATSASQRRKSLVMAVMVLVAVGAERTRWGVQPQERVRRALDCPGVSYTAIGECQPRSSR